MDHGDYARGTLTYEIAALPTGAENGAAETVEVRVSGALAGETKSQVGEAGIATYKITGTQIYSKRLGDWISGDFAIDVTVAISLLGQNFTTAGTMKVSVELLGSEELAQPAGEGGAG